MSLKNLRIGVRLGLGFALILILMIVIAGLSLHQMASIKRGTDQIAQDAWVKARVVMTLKSAALEMDADFRGALLATDSATRNADLQAIAAGRKRIDATLAKADKLFIDAQNRVLIKQVGRDLQRFDSINQRATALLDASQSVQAQTLFNSEGLPLLTKLRSDLNTLDSHQTTYVDALYQQAVTTYHNSQVLTLTLVAIAVLLSVIVAFLITRSITRPISDAVSVANHLAENDLTPRIEVTSTDETGQLLTAMQRMVGNLSRVIAEVRSAADSLSSASEQVSATAQSVSQASTEQAASVEETSASMEEMGASVTQNSENARVTDGIAGEAAGNAAEGGEAVTRR